MKEQEDKEGKGPDRHGERGWVWIFFSAAVAALLGAGGFLFWGFPFLLTRLDPSRWTPVLEQTLWLRCFTLLAFALTSLAAALIAFFVPVRRWNLRWLAAGILALAVLLRLATPDMALNSMIRPDGVHFAVTAEQLLARGSWLVPTGNALLPPRTLPGNSFLLCLSQWTDAKQPAAGIWAVFLCSVLGIWLVYRLAARLFSREAGVIAALLLALSPMHGWYSRQVMSEIPWGLGVVASVYLALFGAPRRWMSLVGGLLLGLGLLFKFSHGLIGIGVLAALGIAGIRKRCPARHVAFFVCGTLLGVLPALLYNRYVLGGWLITPYHLYWPGWASLSGSLNIRYLWSAPLIKGSMGNLPYYALAFLGLDPRPERMPFALPIAFLILLSLFLRRAKRGALQPGESLTSDSTLTFRNLTLFASALYGGACLLYSFQDPRFFLPIVPLWAVAAAAALSGLAKRASAGALRGSAALALALTAAIALGILRVETSGSRLPERALFERLAQASQQFDAIVSDEDPALLTRFGIWNGRTALIPLLREEELWFPPDPKESMRERGVLVEPYEGTLRAVTRQLGEKKRIGVWIRKPHYRPEAHALFVGRFRLRQREDLGVPGLQEIVPGLEPAAASSGVLGAEPARTAEAAPAAAVFPETGAPTIGPLSALPVLGGTFMLGGPGPEGATARNRSLPEHRVSARPFRMDRTEVSAGQFIECLNDLLADSHLIVEPEDEVQTVRLNTLEGPGPAICRMRLQGPAPRIEIDLSSSNRAFRMAGANGRGSSDHPAVNVTWYGAALFCNWQSEKQSLIPRYVVSTNVDWPLRTDGDGYRLPTEAEWEMAACWDGTNRRMYAFGCNWDPARANVAESPRDERLDPESPFTVAVDSHGSEDSGHDGRSPSGLFNMTGNVWEWCHDWYGDYTPASAVDPVGPSTGTIKVVRGGSFRTYRSAAWCAFRGIADPQVCTDDIGFRTVLPAR